MIKTIALITFFVCSLNNSKAQIILIGEDEIKNNYDGYTRDYKISDVAKHGDWYYFISPNGYLYQAGRTENSIKIIDKFAPQNSMFFIATKKYIYYSSSSEGDAYRTVTQLNPATAKINYSLQCPAPYETLSVNGLQVPGNIYTVSQMFQSADKDKLLIRTFKNDLLRVFAIHDDNPTKVYAVYTGALPSTQYPDMSISVNSQVMDRGKDVFVNGRSKASGAYETTSTVIRIDDGSSAYNFLTQFNLKDKGLTLFDNFLRTDSLIYSFCKLDKEGKTDYQLFRYNEKKISGWVVNLSTLNPDYTAQVLNGVIYISNKGEIGKFNEANKQIDKAFKSFLPNEAWAEVQYGKRFLKVGNFLLAKIGNDYQVLNEKSGKWNKMKTPGLAKEPNRSRLTENYAYHGKQHFYFIDTANSMEQFTSYNPLLNTYEAITFPTYKKETFNGIKGIFQHEDGFIILTAYTNKKDKPVYRMFNYIEEINTTTEIAVNENPVIKKEVPKPVKVIKEKSPHKIVNKTSKIVFEETFKNNKNNWALDKSIISDSATAIVKDGALTFDNKQTRVAFVGINIPENAGIKLATDEEWIFKATVKHISGVTNSILGIHFGEVINGNINEGLIFATDADKNNFSIYEKKGNNYTTIKSWTIDAAVKKTNEANELQVIKRPGSLSFFINGKFVFQASSKYAAKAIGFIVQNKQTVVFDNISITSFATLRGKTERDQVNDLVTIFNASDSSFKNQYLTSGSFKKESWLPIISIGNNQFYIYDGIPSPFEKTGIRYAPYYEITTSTNDIKLQEEKTIQLSKLIEAGLESYTKREVATVLGKTFYWQSNNTNLPKDLTVAIENFEISGLYFTKIVIIQAPNIKLPENE